MSEEQEPAATYEDPSSLVPWGRNPKSYDQSDIRKTIRSIERFGFGSPIIARTKTREVIAGHRRRLAAIQMGLSNVPVRFMDLTEDEAHKFCVADNKIGTDKRVKDSDLSKLLIEWSDDGDLVALGFNDDELTRLMGESYESEVQAIDVSETKAQFYLAVSGPLLVQIDALDELRAALSGIEGLSIQCTVTGG
jgi:ParB-like chromosome segregation protein Spo0J